MHHYALTRARRRAAGYTAQAFGLSLTSASHGAFTGTFTVLAVPLLVGLSGRRIANRTWAAGAAALLGAPLSHPSAISRTAFLVTF